ncbi:hypothetical protein SEA_PUPPER_85 [Gordonia phage Pupper]|uniref:Uncharacterized protein n=1 Tax=Gordonia phage Pupper TaxID=2571249 RepID=A0A4Y6EMD6_9CAUD|nr:hypothetical protein KHQ83_gp192 [Gordonia phage Pupper]QDF18571.1 hypothetical protein SEA_PUPPER_85 [Gordonia phage Pupper]QDF18802.1 hypothetical protein SEA_SCENTAE_83 [Gordonia phage SCentae]
MGGTNALVLLFSSAGFLAGVLGLLQFFNTRKLVRSKSEADIASVWNDLTEGSLKNAYERITGLERENRLLKLREDGLYDLIHDLIREFPDPNVRGPFQAELNRLRSMTDDDPAGSGGQQ